MVTKFWIYTIGDLVAGTWKIETSMDLRFNVDEYGREKLRKKLVSFFSELYREVVWVEFNDEREMGWLTK